MRAVTAFLISYYLFGLCCFISMRIAFPGRYPIFHQLEWILTPFILPVIFLFFFPYCLIPIAYFAAFTVFNYYCYYRKKKMDAENAV